MLPPYQENAILPFILLKSPLDCENNVSAIPDAPKKAKEIPKSSIIEEKSEKNTRVL
jgi:hypothetical protein